MPSLTIRKIAPDDQEQWRLLWDGYNAFYGRSGATALAPAITETTWSRFFDASEPVEALVAVNGRELLGLAHYLSHRSTTAIEPTCYLQDLFTRPDRRGNGIGRLLIEGVCQEARRAGARRVYWQTHQSNAVARSVYEKLAKNSGFIVYRIQL
jgi:GNAT superfamily N-acetyltransferase